MRKRLIIYCFLFLALIISIPSIQSIQFNTTNDEAKIKMLNESTGFLDFKFTKELIKSIALNITKHPFLYLLIFFSIKFRHIRIDILSFFAVESDGYYIIVKNYVLFLRELLLISTTFYWIHFWQYLSEQLGWYWGDLFNVFWE